MGYFEKYSKEEISTIVKHSTSFKDFAKKIGYSNSPSGDTIKRLREKLIGYDTTHFLPSKTGQKRTEENTFIQNSTASQNTLRKLFLKKDCVSYKCSICGL